MTIQPVEITKRWINSVVLNLNLCPFAHKVVTEDKIHFVLFEGDSFEELSQLLWKEISVLAFDEDIHHTTTLIILKDLGKDFFDYLDLVEWSNELLSESEAADLIQIAEFHPNYQFEGTLPKDVQNFTNRAPFPMFHLLKEKEVSQALENYPNPENIPQENIKKMNQLGWDGIHQILKKVYDAEGKN